MISSATCHSGPVPSAAMDYQALYRKYRPQRFDAVIGQDHVTKTLSREIVEGKIAHAYLFAGPLVGNDGKKNYFINDEGRVIQSAYQRLFIRAKKI